MKRTDRSVFLLIFIIAISVGAVVFGILQLQTDTLTTVIKEEQPVALLFLISDEQELYFLDILLYHPKTQRGSLFYVPANLGVKIESLDRFDKISVLYKQKDPVVLVDEVERITELSIPFFIDLSLENLKYLVDLIAGVELFISNPIELDYQEHRILLPSGSVRLDGDKIIDYITFEEDGEEERENVGRKQKVLTALLKKMGESATNTFLLEKDSYLLFRRFLNTNLSSKALHSLVAELGKLNTDRILYQRVLGQTKVVDGVEGNLLFAHYDGNLIRQTLKQNLDTIANEVAAYDEAMTITMEILNGTNIDGLAQRTKALFENFGFEVISFHNADNDQYQNTVILDRREKEGAAERVAEVILCERIYAGLDPDLNVDITLILGRDFDGRYCK